MRDRLRILHLEGSAAEAGLIRSRLDAAGLACDFLRVDNQADFERLCAEGIDLVLVEDSRLSFDGPAAVAASKAACPDVPVIFVSELLREEETLDLTKGGVLDFVRSDRLDRLVPILQRALREVKERHERELAQLALSKLEGEFDRRVNERTAKLEADTRKLRGLAVQLASTEQHELARLGHVMHDNLLQLLVAARLHAAVLRDEAPTAALRDGLARIEDVLRQSIDTSRSLTMDLCPAILFEWGVVPAIQWLARHAQEKHRLVVELTVCADADVQTQPMRILLFGGVRELLLNVAKHSGVLAASLSVSKPSPDTLEVAVEDAGRGYNLVDEPVPGRLPTGLGLYAIQEQAQALGGNLQITTAPGRGTRVVLQLPALVPADGPDAPGPQKRASRSR